jgi:hypothetical protein
LPACTSFVFKTTWETLPGLIILKIMINELLVPYLKHRQEQNFDECSSTNVILRKKTLNVSLRAFRDELRANF